MISCGSVLTSTRCTTPSFKVSVIGSPLPPSAGIAVFHIERAARHACTNLASASPVAAADAGVARQSLPSLREALRPGTPLLSLSQPGEIRLLAARRWEDDSVGKDGCGRGSTVRVQGE